MNKFNKVNFEEIKEQIISYTKGLRLVDTYWEWYILDAELYEILIDNSYAGFFSIHKEECMLTSFYMDDIAASARLFEEILLEFDIKCAYVVTNDEGLLSLCLDRQIRIEMQAYFFDDSDKKIADPEFPRELLQLAAAADLPQLIKLDFFDPLEIGNEEDLIYVMRDKNAVFMGAGHLHRMQLERKWGAVGMVVAEEFRKKGVGRSIILHLKEITKQKGLIPIAGCWYYNHGSKKTLESCGFTSKTRLLKVFFEPVQKG